MTSKTQIKSKDVQGLKYLDALSPLLRRLHDVGAARDKAGNRQLYMDHYCMMVLIWLYSPLLTSLRAVQQATQLRHIQRRFKIPPAALGTLSESVRIFDPEPLKRIAEELGHELDTHAKQTHGNFGSLNQKITAVDGSVVKILTQVAELAWVQVGEGKPTCGYRLHAQFEVLKDLPNRIDTTSANPKGDNDERAVLERTLEKDRLYVMDRGYQKWSLWNAIVRQGSSYICRARDNSTPETLRDRELTEDDRNAGVRVDREVVLGAAGSNKKTVATNHPVRYLEIEVPPHVRTGKGGSGSDGRLRLVTNVMDVPAELIAEAYRLRWLIELFFRMIKQLLGCRHLLSTKPGGVEIQMYLAIIACLLILIYTGGQPTKRTYEMICFYLLGWASLEELHAHIKNLKVKQA